MIGNGKSFGKAPKKFFIMRYKNVDVSLNRVSIRIHEGNPLVHITLDADTTITMLGDTKEVNHSMRLYETPRTKYLDPAIVLAFWNEVQRATVDNIDKVRY